MEQNKFPRILIVASVTYRKDNQSRAADTYFHNWPKNHLRQIFSSTEKPLKGHCSSFYQITDLDLFKSIFHKNDSIGNIINDDETSEYQDKNDSKPSKIAFLKKKTFLRYYLRKMLWSKKRWLTKKLEQWVDDFKPEILYCGASDDYYIMDISLYFSKKYNIPIVITIGDDYYFLKTSFLLKPYISAYRKKFDEIMNTDGFGVYISDKIANKYNSYFRKQGFPVYLSSSITETNNKIIKYEFNYFGNVELGRYKPLACLANALNMINKSFILNVYCNYPGKMIVSFLKRNHCIVHSPISYDRVVQIMNSGSFNIVASSFSKRDIEKTRYSLSTKVADCLISSGPIIAIGPIGDGAIDYLKKRDCAIVLDHKKIDISKLKEDIYNKDYILRNIRKSKQVYKEEHNLERNRAAFEEACEQLANRFLTNYLDK